MYNTTGGYNVTMGAKAMFKNETGSNNVAIGKSALYNSTVSGNVALGNEALYANTTGEYNIGVGNDSNYTSDTLNIPSTAAGALNNLQVDSDNFI